MARSNEIRAWGLNPYMLTVKNRPNERKVKKTKILKESTFAYSKTTR